MPNRPGHAGLSFSGAHRHDPNTLTSAADAVYPLPASVPQRIGLAHLKTRLFGTRRPAVFPKDTQALIRSELFGIERFEQHAESLAAAQRITADPNSGRRLDRRLKDNGRALLASYRGVEKAIREERHITPADEWLLDNFYVAQEQIRQVRDDLPHGFYRGLPKLAEGPLEGYPRIYGVAWAFIAHTDSRVDREMLLHFVAAYQRVQPLTIGELWAVAIALRIVLIENLRRAADQVANARIERALADRLADRLLGTDGASTPLPETALLPFDAMPLPRPFVVRLLERLRDQDPRVTWTLGWLDKRLAAENTNGDEIIRAEHQRLVGTNVTVRNIITSMRLVSALDWAKVLESTSLVDAALRAESDFAEMDFSTRDRYRHAIEELARGSGQSELEVARRAIAAARSSRRPTDPAGDRKQEPGYYLLANGRRQFETEIGFRIPLSNWLIRTATRAGVLGYVGGIAVVLSVIMALPLIALAEFGIGGWLLVVFAFLGLAPASDLAVAIINRAITRDLKPKPLPGLELRAGIPAGLRTIVVVPTLLTTQGELEEQIERMEVHYLANQDGDLYFTLLSDWVDSASQIAPGDDELLSAAAHGIAELNQRYGPAPSGPRFFLLHRRRMWNEGQGKWIGWERKRGKLHELNRWLRGASDTTFVSDGDALPSPPPDVRYVITLDADTRLPRGSAKRLVGKMAHPLNRPRLDPINGRVVEGYAVLQPRVTPSLPKASEGSLFQRVFTSPSGLDPYAFAVSDVYQDLFGEGSYSGKGIYDVDMFEAALEQRIPESTLLSHDLLEGIFARSGLVSDIEVVEEFPARYSVAAARQHRWARGDWQLLPWIFGRGRSSTSEHDRSAIPFLGRWKMLDNLRRTLSAPAVFVALLGGWMLPLMPAVIWTGFVVATFTLPAFLPAILAIVPRRLGLSQRRHWHTVGADFGLAFLQLGLLITLIASQAWLMADAIYRTLFRLFVRRRRLLEWVTAAQVKVSNRFGLFGMYLWMSGGVALAVVAGAIIVFWEPRAWLVAAPFITLWILSPLIAQWASLPLCGSSIPVSETDAKALRHSARRTWRFFEQFVTAEHHHLPPDNFQEDPKPVVAHRTSPTNIGLYLLSVIAARDFGWIGTHESVDRLEATLASMKSLERFRGHFYNWYDTHDLHPLDPKYISAVDSGNLAGHLIALGSACREMIAGPPVAPQWLDGIEDGLELTRQSLHLLPDDKRTHIVTRDHLADALDVLSATLVTIRQSGDVSTLHELKSHAETVVDIARTLSAERSDNASVELLTCASALQASISSHERDLQNDDPVAIDLLQRSAGVAQSLKKRLEAVLELSRTIFEEMKFDLLFDPDRQLLSIGYRVAEGALDASYYDLLASEARLASFVAIAKGDVPTRHWFHLGRTVTSVSGDAALVSWSGSMFEYLMPNLVMRPPPGCLIDDTNHNVVRRQEEYGAERGLPWGVSESAYNARDLEFTYQYSSFGVPGLGLKRCLGDDAVVAPYATALAAMLAPDAAVRNFARLEDAGARGRYGWYEALDYTASRVPENAKVAVVRCYMAHHQGMTLVALANGLRDGAMRARFHAEPIIQATELLLQERTPRDVDAFRPRQEDVKAASYVRELIPPSSRHFRSPHQKAVQTQLLSNGRYAVMMTAAGSGYSHWNQLALTRWREDPTCDCWGSYFFLRDAHSGKVWSAGFQPSGVEPDSYDASFFEDRVEITRRDGTITTRLEVTVSPEDDAEARRITISNEGNRAREIEVTSYAEIVLAPQAADVAHPAFSNLFVQTEFVSDIGALLATRRRGSPDEPHVWLAHLAVVEGDAVAGVQFETDRARFLGRGRVIRTPVSVIDGQPLSNTTGAVLDPIFSLRRRLRLAPGTTVHITFWTLAASSRSAVLDLADKHSNPAAFERLLTLAWTQAQVQLFHLGINSDEATMFQGLASRVLYANPSLRPSSDLLSQTEAAQPALWSYGISGDLPIVLCRIDNIEHLQIVRQLIQAHEYWRMKQLAVDLVILNEYPPTYAHELRATLEGMVRATESRRLSAGASAAVQGAVFILRAELLSDEARNLLQSAARAVFFSRRGSLFEQLRRLDEAELAVSKSQLRVAPKGVQQSVPRPELEFFNGLGGFSNDGREYLTVLGPGQWTPAPWLNVIANPSFGFQTSVEGAGYTWATNSQQNELTPWSNDPVSDRPGEVIYIRDEDDGMLWTPTALPIREESEQYIVRHGQGYSRFEHVSHGISLELLQYVPSDDPIKISRLKIRNQSTRARRLSITGYVEWVLGNSRSSSAPFIVTEIDPETKVMLARNHWSAAFGTRVAFADMGGRQLAWTGDRTEFLGRNGSLDSPAALAEGIGLTNKVGGGLDPCGALQTTIELQANGSTEIVFFLGETATKVEALALIKRYRAADLDEVFNATTGVWNDLLGTIQLKTPDRAMDVLMNRWLLYQTLGCRVWARAAFYQASGAYGFRDQLQDVMALGNSKPQITRKHLLRAAARQFTEGDVQHWWLPPLGQGVRTRISDDRLWLPYVTAQYIEVTGDIGVLDEIVPFLDGAKLGADQLESFFQPTISNEQGSLYEHCARALETSLSMGIHGLPLMGTGDWNDGMNRVGVGGKGESIWLGWFLYATLSAFAPLADRRGEKTRSATWRQHAANLQKSLERDGWEGQWYRRAYFDDGTPLGGHSDAECRIDSIAQSWSVLSGAGEKSRAVAAMAAVNEQLVRRDDELVLLFTPPFDQTPLDPGYIKRYPPGIRENGGQYTHGAVWSVIAFAMLGDGDKAGELFSILNPINHARTRADIFRYKVEPYVACADIYAEPAHIGRGGWTWYTGSAGWMYRAGLEWILGFRLRGATLLIDPCIPRSWPGFEITFKYHSARYDISVENPRGVSRGVSSIRLDGVALQISDASIPLSDDGANHKVEVVLG
ncbi:MAG: glycosyl transferase [Chthoniobacterales bacterium]|nr:MAG: glycosyl transferase [Chthoniobacterales bacterium]